jgi:hypothetical protein
VPEGPITFPPPLLNEIRGWSRRDAQNERGAYHRRNVSASSFVNGANVRPPATLRSACLKKKKKKPRQERRSRQPRRASLVRLPAKAYLKHLISTDLRYAGEKAWQKILHGRRRVSAQGKIEDDKQTAETAVEPKGRALTMTQTF